jgi:hypothetical protein
MDSSRNCTSYLKPADVERALAEHSSSVMHDDRIVRYGYVSVLFMDNTRCITLGTRYVSSRTPSLVTGDGLLLLQQECHIQIDFTVRSSPISSSLPNISESRCDSSRSISSSSSSYSSLSNGSQLNLHNYSTRAPSSSSSYSVVSDFIYSDSGCPSGEAIATTPRHTHISTTLPCTLLPSYKSSHTTIELYEPSRDEYFFSGDRPSAASTHFVVLPVETKILDHDLNSDSLPFIQDPPLALAPGVMQVPPKKTFASRLYRFVRW